jgi:hypothetical protein
MKLLLVLSFFCLVNALAQEQQYELKGMIGTNVTTNTKIQFNLKWNEKDGKANGIYSDNFYTKSAPAKGISGELGRIFVVTFPKEIKGVRTITLLGSDVKKDKGAVNIPVSVVLRDDNGKPLTTNSIQASFAARTDTRVAQRQEAGNCQEGFGVLAGHCGVYVGMLTEEADSNNKCDLLSFPNTRLILDSNAEMGLSLGEVSEIVNPPIHRIGRLFTDPDSTRIDLTSRSCRPMAGTTFAGENCKRLNLSGIFSTLKNVRHFLGYYTILDEKTNQLCRYRLSMDQAI